MKHNDKGFHSHIISGGVHRGDRRLLEGGLGISAVREGRVGGLVAAGVQGVDALDWKVTARQTPVAGV